MLLGARWTGSGWHYPVVMVSGVGYKRKGLKRRVEHQLVSAADFRRQNRRFTTLAGASTYRARRRLQIARIARIMTAASRYPFLQCKKSTSARLFPKRKLPRDFFQNDSFSRRSPESRAGTPPDRDVHFYSVKNQLSRDYFRNGSTCRAFFPK